MSRQSVAALSEGDIFYSQDIQDQLGPGTIFYFPGYYADPRGFNLPNELAQGLLKPEHVNAHIVHLTIHTLLVFGLCKRVRVLQEGCSHAVLRPPGGA